MVDFALIDVYRITVFQRKSLQTIKVETNGSSMYVLRKEVKSSYELKHNLKGLPVSFVFVQTFFLPDKCLQNVLGFGETRLHFA